MGALELEVETDAQLVRRVAVHGGTSAARAAETELCRRFAPRVRLYGLRHLRNPERAMDLVQAVLMALLEAVRAQRINETEHVDRFVLGTCRYVAARMRAGDSRTVSLDPADLDVAGPASMPSLEHLDADALFRCLAKLDERGRAVVRLCFQEYRTALEIASTMGTTAGNVRVLRHRAIAQLRSCLDERSAEVAPSAPSAPLARPARGGGQPA